jgi:hypothetical protein
LPPHNEYYAHAAQQQHHTPPCCESAPQIVEQEELTLNFWANMQELIQCKQQQHTLLGTWAAQGKVMT